MVANGEHQRQWDPTVCHAPCKPNHLGGSGKFTEEHVEHRNDEAAMPIRRNQTLVGLLVASVGSGDQEVDEHRNKQQTHGQVSRLYRMVRMGFSEVSTSRKPKMNGRMYVASKTAVSRRATIEALASLARRLPFRAVATIPLPTSPYRRAMVRSWLPE